MSLLKRMEILKNDPAPDRKESGIKENKDISTRPGIADPLFTIKERVRTLTIEALNDVEGSDEKLVREKIEEILDQESSGITRVEKSRIIDELIDDILGYGPLEPILADPKITELMINGPEYCYVEEKGKLRRIDLKFRNQEHLLTIIDRIVSSIGRHVDEASPMVDARLKDGSRVNVIIPPLSLVGPVMTIRKFSKTPFCAADLVSFGSLSPKMVSFLEACVKGRLNMIVAGGTGSGKTTLLNVLSGFIPSDERIVTIEDAAEIQLSQEHVVTLESRPSNTEGRGQISIRDLVRNSLRMRPDRIIVGEVRSGEALDMLQAMNTGHDGSLTTTHANSPRDTIARIETMVMMAGMELPIMAIRSQIASAVDVIIQQARMRDGTRRVTHITEITGMEGDTIQMQDIFVFRSDGRTDNTGMFRGEFTGTGIYPICVDKIRLNGIHVHDDWFK